MSERTIFGKVFEGDVRKAGAVLSVLDLVSTLPLVLSENETFGALAKTAAAQLLAVDRLIERVLIFPRVDVLPEEILDLLAEDMHIDWYDRAADLAVKRVVIKGSVAVHRHLGTRWAVAKVIVDYFGAGAVREWWEYGGEPHHFKIISGNAEMVGEHLEEFLAMLEHVKRKSSWLDAVQVGLTGETEVFCGMAVRECDRDWVDLTGRTGEAAHPGARSF